jgi:hypothetical protein
VSQTPLNRAHASLVRKTAPTPGTCKVKLMSYPVKSSYGREPTF